MRHKRGERGGSERENEKREREHEKERERVCVCVTKRQRDKETKRKRCLNIPSCLICFLSFLPRFPEAGKFGDGDRDGG